MLKKRDNNNKEEIKTKLNDMVGNIKNIIASIDNQLNNTPMSPNKYNDYKCKKECYEDCLSFVSGVVSNVNTILDAPTPVETVRVKKPLLEGNVIDEKKDK